jgi:hypothetical protein
LLSADEETTSASLIFCLKQAVLKYTQAEEEEDSSRKKVGIISMLKNWSDTESLGNRKKLIDFIKIEVIMICGFSLRSMLQFLLLSEMLCIPAQGDSFTNTYKVLEENYMEIR